MESVKLSFHFSESTNLISMAEIFSLLTQFLRIRNKCPVLYKKKKKKEKKTLH